MEIQPVTPGDAQFIQSYRPGGFTVSNIAYEGGILVFTGRTEPWAPADVGALEAAHLDAIAQAEPSLEVLLIGCGAKMTLLPGAIRRHFTRVPFSVDVMETGAACRTFNILVAESRRVAAALLPV